MNIPTKTIPWLSVLMFCGSVHAGSNHNPASMNYVDTQVALLNAKIPSFSVGDTFQGGTVYYVDSTGQHGLIFYDNLADTTAVRLLEESASGDTINTYASGVGAGVQNTAAWNAALLASSAANSTNTPKTTSNVGGAAAYAAQFTLDAAGAPCPSPTTGSFSTTTCFGGYYLPSLNEFELLVNSGLFNPTSDAIWWTSTSNSVGATTVFAVSYASGSYTVIDSDPTTVHQVIPIRQF